MAESDKKPHAEGQREQYGVGKKYRKADLSEGADEANDLGGFAGGERPSKSIPDPKKPEGDQ
jgi:hypothetical protein